VSATQLWNAFYTLALKEVIRVLRIWQQTLLPPVITMGIYFVVFGSFLGSRIKEINGYPYIQFILPGLMMMTTINNSFSNVASSFFSNKFQRSVEELLVAPIPPWIIVLGYMSGGVIRGILTGLLVAVVGLAFTTVPVVHPILAFLLMTLTAGFFSLAGLINAVLARKFDDIAIVPTFILTPLTYFSGVFYSIKQLPPMWKTVSEVNPIYLMVDGFRQALLGVGDTSMGLGFGVLIVCNVVLFAVALSLFRRGIGLRT
jgi:ABC-2 type transport system permease protein